MKTTVVAIVNKVYCFAWLCFGFANYNLNDLRISSCRIPGMGNASVWSAIDG